MVIHTVYSLRKKGASFDKLHTGEERARDANFSGANTHEGWSYFIQGGGLLIFCYHYW